MDAPQPRLTLTLREMAQALNLSEETVRRKCQIGSIPGAFRTRGKTGHWRANRRVFEEWVARLCPFQRIRVRK